MFPRFDLAPDEALAGAMPPSAPGAMPGGAGPAPAPAPDEGLGGDTWAPEGGDDDGGPDGAPPAPPPPTEYQAQPPAAAHEPLTPSMEGLTQAAYQLAQVRDHIQQRYPVVHAQREAIENMLRGVRYDDLAPEQQAWASQMYGQWQQLATEEQNLTAKWGEFQQAVPMLQAAYQLEQQRAMMNRVGEPLAHHLLAQRAKERSGDADFPVEAMAEFLKDIPPNALDVVSTKLEAFWRKHARGRRQADGVDQMGPAGGGGEAWGKASGRDLIRSAVADEMRRHPPRM